METTLPPPAELPSSNRVQNKEKITTFYPKWQQQTFSKALSLLKLQESAAARLAKATCPRSPLNSVAVLPTAQPSHPRMGWWGHGLQTGRREGLDLTTACLLARCCCVWIELRAGCVCSKHRKRADAGVEWNCWQWFQVLIKMTPLGVACDSLNEG